MFLSGFSKQTLESNTNQTFAKGGSIADEYNSEKQDLPDIIFHFRCYYTVILSLLQAICDFNFFVGSVVFTLWHSLFYSAPLPLKLLTCSRFKCIVFPLGNSIRALKLRILWDCNVYVYNKNVHWANYTTV